MGAVIGSIILGIFISILGFSNMKGNISSIHWDLVLIQRKEYGGGEIYFDDILIRKDGIFILPELEKLNFKNY